MSLFSRIRLYMVIPWIYLLICLLWCLSAFAVGSKEASNIMRDMKRGLDN